MLTTLAPAFASAAVQTLPHWGPMGVGFGWFFLVIPLFWIAVIVTLAIVFGRRRRAMWAHGGPWSASHSAEQTLAERFAHGDIDETEYRARLEVLRANRQP